VSYKGMGQTAFGHSGLGATEAQQQQYKTWCQGQGGKYSAPSWYDLFGSGVGSCDFSAAKVACQQAGGSWEMLSSSCRTAKGLLSPATIEESVAKSLAAGQGGSTTTTTGQWTMTTPSGQLSPAGPTSSPEQIKTWQLYLNSKGCKLAVDGAWGPMTQAATTAVVAGKPCPTTAGTGPYTPVLPPIAPTPPLTMGAPGKDTILGMPKAAVYVGAGSLVLLGAALLLTRKKGIVPKAMPAPVVAKANRRAGTAHV
jgi:hypothetical protein